MTEAIIEGFKILLVDDEEFNLDILEEYIEQRGFKTAQANNGKEALEKMSEEDFDIIILDRMMPIMNGMEFLEIVKSHNRFKKIPVIMQTAATSDEEITEGIEAGVFYYLAKPFSKSVFLSILNSAIEHLIENRKITSDAHILKNSAGIVKEFKLEIKDLKDAKTAADYVAILCPKSEQIKFGLSELLVNGVEHGNLGITFIEKRKLLEELKWETEISERLKKPEFKDKRVRLSFLNNGETVIIKISDEGEGFTPEDFFEIEKERLMLPNGRGIAMTKKLSFDKMDYNEKGNEVTCTINL